MMPHCGKRLRWVTTPKKNILRAILFIISIVMLGACDSSIDPNHLGTAVRTFSIPLLYDTLNNPLTRNIDTFFKKRHQQRRFNGVALFASEGKIIYHKAFGLANFSTKDSLKPTHAFQLASVSKPLTALGVLKLSEQKRLQLDTVVQAYIPSFPYENISIRFLLTHRSGLPNYMYFVDKIWEDKSKPVSNQEVLNIMVRDTPKIYALPDRYYNYSNTNYAVLASVIEKVSGMTYEAFMQRHIFTPVGMDSTFVYNKNTQAEFPKPVIGYNAIYRQKENIYQNGVVGDKGIYASALDLYKLDRALVKGLVLSPEIQEIAYEPQHADLTRRHRDNYGLGWRLQKEPYFGKVVYHGGWWKGFKTYFIRLLDRDQTIVILTNVTRGGYLNRMLIQQLMNPDVDIKQK